MFGCQSLWFTHYNQCFCVCRLSPKLQGIFQIGAESGTKLCILVVSWTLLNKCSMSERIWAIQKTEPNRPSRMLTETHHGGPRVDALLGVASFLVEAYIEGPHRSFNREHGRAFSSRIPWISSSMNSPPTWSFTHVSVQHRIWVGGMVGTELGMSWGLRHIDTTKCHD